MSARARCWFIASFAVACVSACKSSQSGDGRDPGISDRAARAEPAGCAPVTADALRVRAQDVVGLSMQLTPALPVSWPTSRAGVMYLAYPSETLLTESQRTRLRSPTYRIVFAPGHAEPRVERLVSSRVLGTQDDTAEPIAPALVRSAEQALVDIVSGCRTAEQAATDLRPYLQWLDEQPIIAQDLGSRLGTFMAWLRTIRR